MQGSATESACYRLLTVKEVAARLRVSPATVYALCERGDLAYVRVTTHAIRVSERALGRFIGPGLTSGDGVFPRGLAGTAAIKRDG